MLVADEIHEVRNPGKRLNAFIALALSVGFIFLLSATPVVTRPEVRAILHTSVVVLTLGI